MQKRKNDVIRKATHIFSLYGPKSATMEQVATSVGISKRTLYEMFETKNVLVMAVAEGLLEKNKQFARVCGSMSPNALIELNNLFTHIHDLLLATTSHFLFELKRFYPDAYQLLENYSLAMLTDFMNKNLARGAAEEIYQAGIENRDTGRFYHWLLKMIIENISPGNENTKWVITHIHDFLVHGIINAEGERMLRILKLPDPVSGTPFAGL